jgi:hypothetical protein
MKKVLVLVVFLSVNLLLRGQAFIDQRIEFVTSYEESLRTKVFNKCYTELRVINENNVYLIDSSVFLLIDANYVNDSIELFPKDRKKKHEENTIAIKLIVNPVYDKGIRTQYEKWNEILEYSNDDLRIEVAATHKLILEEGIALNHCVGGDNYCKRMANGERLILFIRKDDKPYSTLEFNTEVLTVIQHRAHTDKDPEEKVKKFIEKWKKIKLTNMRKPESLAM